MGVFERMGRVISANFNALLDSAEDPRKSLDTTLKEMGDQVRAARQEVVKSVAAEKQLRNKGETLGQELDRWERRAELAVAHGDDELARQALQHKRRLLAERDRVEQLRLEQRGVALEMKAEVERMEIKLEELKSRRGTLVAQAEQARAGGGVEALGARGPGGGAFSEFRRMEAEIEGVEAAFAAQREVDEALGPGRGPSGMTADEVEARFRRLEQGGPEARGPGDDVDEELQALKRRVRVKT
jgi:phage shock protein A